MTSVREIFDTMEYGPAPEGDAPAREWLSRHGARFGHYIGGAWTKPASPFDVSNPATGKVIAQVSQGSKRDIDAGSCVAWSDRRHGMGLQFEKVEPHDQAAIDEFVDAHFFSSRKA